MSLSDAIVGHLGWIRSKALTICAGTDDAEEVAAETVFRCLMAKDVDLGRPLKPWILTVMVNVCKNRSRIVGRYTPLPDSDILRVDRATPESSLIRDEMVRLLKCHRTASRSIETVILYAMGYTYDEIAERYGIPLGTVKSRVNIGRRILREVFNG